MGSGPGNVGAASLSIQNPLPLDGHASSSPSHPRDAPSSSTSQSGAARASIFLSDMARDMGVPQPAHRAAEKTRSAGEEVLRSVGANIGPGVQMRRESASSNVHSEGKEDDSETQENIPAQYPNFDSHEDDSAGLSEPLIFYVGPPISRDDSDDGR